MGERFYIAPVGTKSKRRVTDIRYDRLMSIESLLIFDEKQQRREEIYKKYGTRKYIWKGTLDRIQGRQFDITGLDEGDAISYYYGYYERGTRVIDSSIQKGYIKYEYKEKDIKKLYYVSPEDYNDALINIAINDGMNSEIKRENLTDIIKNNDIYNMGYIIGISKSSENKKVKKRVI